MDLKLNNKTILVTGGSYGLGRSICEILAEEGANVGVNFRRYPEKADKVVRKIEASCGKAVAVHG
ncbi:MAG: SDR family NAD(P)-dependent oxidoreductase, partial [Pirellulales bacterium]|nr:SDR family NAD(P)-dependent oxidoreductase [Pirellulales bacterium]